jgi:hypothetical protein
MINMNHLYLTGSFCFTLNIKGKDHYVSLSLGEHDVRPAYDYMVSLRELPERIEGVVTNCLKNNGAGQAAVCVIEYLAENGATLIQLKHLDVTVEELHDREPDSFYHANVPVLSYDEFRRIIEGTNSKAGM